MFVADNYGSKWVKGIINWFRTKTLDGIDYPILIIEATLECGLRRNKLIELVNEYIETGLLDVRDGRVFWTNPDIKPFETIMRKETIAVVPRLTDEEKKKRAEKKNKKKKKKKKKKTLQEKLVEYNEYIEYMKIENETPLEYEEWVKMKGYK